MPKKTVSKKCLLHDGQLKEVNVKLDSLTLMFSKHIEESVEVRNAIIKYTERMDWHKKWLFVVSGGLLTLFTWATGKSFFGN